MTDALTLQCISTGLVFITAIFVWWQIIEMRRSTQAQAYGVARDILQDEKVRDSRDTVFKLKVNNRSIDDWSVSEENQAQIVCHTFDSVGQMVRYKYLQKEAIIDSWGPSIIGLWPVVKPLVIKYRKDWKAKRYWDDFEWLYGEAIEFEKAMEE